MYDYLIVGAGLFGSVCAYELNKKGYTCLVIDKRNTIAGNIYTKNEDNIIVHEYGAHIFHTSDEKIWNYINQFSKFNNYIHKVKANYQNKLYSLPFNFYTFKEIWDDVYDEKSIINKINDDKVEFKEIDNLEKKAISLVGKKVYETLIKGYTQKQWGRECSKLPPFIIERIPVRYTCDDRYFNDKYQGVPIGGYTPIIEKMLEGIDVRLNCDFIKEKEPLMSECKNIIYTGQIDEFFDYKYGKLEYRTLKFEKKKLNVDFYQNYSVINFTDYNVPYTRIIEHKHFDNCLCNDTIITYEFPDKWENGKEPFYPINDSKNNNLYLKYKNEAKNYNNLIFGGRLGEYKYYDMDDVIKSALNLVSNIAKK